VKWRRDATLVSEFFVLQSPVHLGLLHRLRHLQQVFLLRLELIELLMDVADVLGNVFDIILVVSHLLQTLGRLLQLEDVLAELSIGSIKTIIVDVIAAPLELVPLCTEYHADRRGLQLVFPLHLHK
jgi:hypothetical protein